MYTVEKLKKEREKKNKNNLSLSEPTELVKERRTI